MSTRSSLSWHSPLPRQGLAPAVSMPNLAVCFGTWKRTFPEEQYRYSAGCSHDQPPKKCWTPGQHLQSVGPRRDRGEGRKGRVLLATIISGRERVDEFFTCVGLFYRRIHKLGRGQPRAVYLLCMQLVTPTPIPRTHLEVPRQYGRPWR